MTSLTNKDIYLIMKALVAYGEASGILGHDEEMLEAAHLINRLIRLLETAEAKINASEGMTTWVM